MKSIRVGVPILVLAGCFGLNGDWVRDQRIEDLTAADYQLRRRASYLLLADGRGAAELLSASLDDPDPITRVEVARHLSEISQYNGEQVARLKRALNDSNCLVRQYLCDALRAAGPAGRSAVPELLELVNDENASVQYQALSAIGAVASGEESSFDSVVAALEDPNSYVREIAARVAGNLNLRSATDTLLEMALSDEVIVVREEAARSLEKIGLALLRRTLENGVAKARAQPVPELGRQKLDAILQAPAAGSEDQKWLRARICGEFEQQKALLINWSDFAAPFTETIAEVIRAVRERLEVVVCVGNGHERKRAIDYLHEVGIPTASVHFVKIPLEIPWTRDAGAVFFKTSNGVPAVLATKVQGDVPSIGNQLAGVAAAVHEAPLVLEGGHLIANGRGLCLVSQAVLDTQRQSFVREGLTACFEGSCVFLEPLVGEPTRHLDVFATFASADTLVVGAYAESQDRRNTALLERNVGRLADQPSIKIVRIPMPTNADGVWRTYTNVIFANGLLLMPSYSQVDKARERAAIAVFQRALPDWQIKTINCDSLIEWGGALRCISLNIPD